MKKGNEQSVILLIDLIVELIKTIKGILSKNYLGIFLLLPKLIGLRKKIENAILVFKGIDQETMNKIIEYIISVGITKSSAESLVKLLSTTKPSIISIINIVEFNPSYLKSL